MKGLIIKIERLLLNRDIDSVVPILDWSEDSEKTPP
jgi:hypothetical protein